MADAYTLVPIGAHIANSSLSSAAPVTMPANATHLLVQALTANIRYTMDGTTPTASVGFRITADQDPILIPAAKETRLNFIQEAANASLQAQPVNKINSD